MLHFIAAALAALAITTATPRMASGTVTNIHGDVATITTTDGNVWEWGVESPMHLGQSVSLTFDAQCTDDVTDDIILSVVSDWPRAALEG